MQNLLSPTLGIETAKRAGPRPAWPLGRWPRLAFLAGLLLGGGTLVSSAEGRDEPAPAAKDDFSPLVKLAPLVVNGQQLTISIHARSSRDRRYATDFAEEVVKVVYETVTPETGKGLVIIGAKHEPHPIIVFRKFLALADAGKLDPAIAARAPELFARINRWKDTVDDDKTKGTDKKERPEPGEDLDFEKILTALPLPLDGMGAKLYQIAWAEKFDDAKIETRLCALRPADLERRDLFARYDWVFYLPPKGAFDRVLNQIINDALKDEETGFFARTMVKGVLLVVKPKIRQAIEAVRRGMMLMTVVEARGHLTKEQVNELTGTYIESQMPGENHGSGTPHERAVRAVRQKLEAQAAKASPIKPAAAPEAVEADPVASENDDVET